MSFFDRNIYAIEISAKIMFRVNLTIIILIYLAGPVSLFSLVVVAGLCAAKLILQSAEETQERLDREAADAAALWQEQRRVNREYELRRQIRRLQQERQRAPPGAHRPRQRPDVHDNVSSGAATT